METSVTSKFNVFMRMGIGSKWCWRQEGQLFSPIIYSLLISFYHVPHWSFGSVQLTAWHLPCLLDQAVEDDEASACMGKIEQPDGTGGGLYLQFVTDAL